FRALVTTSASVVWTADREGTISEVQGWETFTGAPLAEGRWGWLDAVHPDDRAGARRAWEVAVAGRAGFVHALRLARPGGGHTPVAFRAVPLGEGAARGWAGTGTVLDAPAASGRAPDRFLGVLAHDLRNPLGAVL